MATAAWAALAVWVPLATRPHPTEATVALAVPEAWPVREVQLAEPMRRRVQLALMATAAMGETVVPALIIQMVMAEMAATAVHELSQVMRMVSARAAI